MHHIVTGKDITEMIIIVIIALYPQFAQKTLAYASLRMLDVLFSFVFYCWVYCSFLSFRWCFLYCDFYTIGCSLPLAVCGTKNDAIGSCFIKCVRNGLYIASFAVIAKVPANGIGFCAACYSRIKLKRGWCNTFCSV